MRARFRRWLERRRLLRLADLERRLGPYTAYGTGPYGASSPDQRRDQLDHALLKAKLELSQIRDAMSGR